MIKFGILLRLGWSEQRHRLVSARQICRKSLIIVLSRINSIALMSAKYRDSDPILTTLVIPQTFFTGFHLLLKNTQCPFEYKPQRGTTWQTPANWMRTFLENSFCEVTAGELKTHHQSLTNDHVANADHIWPLMVWALLISPWHSCSGS